MPDWTDYVERDDLLAVLQDGGPDTRACYDLRGITGSGKSVLLQQLQHRLGEHHNVVLIDARDHVTAAEQVPPAGSPARLQDDVRRFTRACAAVLGGADNRPHEVVAVLDAMLDDLGQVQATTVPDGPAGADDTALADEVTELIRRMRERIGALVALHAAAGRRSFFLVDSFDVVRDQLRRWFLDLLGGLPGLVVIAHDARDSEPVLPGCTGVVEVGGLTAAQVEGYLRGRLGPVDPAVISAAHAFTDGHALSVGLLADLIAERRDHVNATTSDILDLIDRLRAVHADPLGRPRRLLNALLDSVREHDPAAYRGLECLWAVRRFDSPLLRHLLTADGSAEPDPRFVEHFTTYSFVQRRTPPGRPGERYHVIHDVARRNGLDRTDPSRLRTVHRAAEEYYQDLTTRYLDDYEGWFRHEDPRWQAMVREWLYHVACLGDTSLPHQGEDPDQESGRVGLARLFLDAFWWWGNYVPFAFCEQLLADWAETAQTKALEGEVDRAWGDALHGIYLGFPKGWRRQASAAEWRAVRQRLVFLRNRKELNGRNLTRKGVRRVRGLLDIFLADATRYLDPHDPRVVALLEDAHEQFAANDDAWNVAWTAFETADAALHRGDTETAVAAADEVVDDLDDFDDAELVANVHRVHADAAWLDGNHDHAVDCLARAALHAYRFQMSSGDPDIPPTDEYTQAFLTEMHERLADRITAWCAASGPEAPAAACLRARHFFRSYWAAAGADDPPDLEALLASGRAGEVAAHTFPAPPASSDLHQTDTAYVLLAGEVIYELADELSSPPGSPLPPDAAAG